MSESERAGARARAREREWERERELRVLLYKHLYCRVLELSRALSLSVIDHLCVLLQTAWGVRPSCRAAHHARVRLPRRRGFPAARVRVHCRSLHQGAAPRSDFTASCARSHARTLARTHARTHAASPSLTLDAEHRGDYPIAQFVVSMGCDCLARAPACAVRATKRGG